MHSSRDQTVFYILILWLIAANVFGKPKTNTDFLPYNGEGFKLSIPSKWNPSKEREFPGQVLRYEDNFDSNSNVSVIINSTDKKSITDYGSPEEFLSKVYIFLWLVFNFSFRSRGIRIFCLGIFSRIGFLLISWNVSFY